MLLVPAIAAAYEGLFERMDRQEPLAALFKDVEIKADVQAGMFFGTGTERWQRLPNGGLKLERAWEYQRVRHPEKGTVHTLPQPWHAYGTLELTAQLRLVRSETRLKFLRSADQLLEDYVLSEEKPKMFEWDRSVTRAVGANKMERTTYLGKEVIDSDDYDYPSDVVPLEIAGLWLAAAVHRNIDRFDFELMLPGGSLHGVRVQVHRTRDVRPLAKKYRLPPRFLKPAAEDLAVAEMRLSSPIKRVFFPHHFYMAFASADPQRLELAWGGNPDEPMQAFRVP
jgi:hypothetical protein